MRRPGTRPIAGVVACSPDAELLEAICEQLVDRGIGPLPAADVGLAAYLCRYGRAEALILDLGMPDGSALDLLRRRAEPSGFDELAVLALAPIGEVPRPSGDDPGIAVDDLLTRPIDLDHMVHRLEALLRRRRGRHEAVLQLGDLVIDPPRHAVTVGGRSVRLARKEFILLRALASDPTSVFSKEELLRDVWGVERTATNTRTLDSQASRLRRKLDPEVARFVVNCWGVGYRLMDLDEAGPMDDGGGEDR